MSIREAARVFGLHRETVSKMLRYSVPPGYRRSEPVRRPKLDAFTGIIDRILAEDRSAPRKQRHTVKRIFERLRDEHGFEGGYTIVKDYVRERRLRSREVFVPLAHDPGHAQVDFGEALVVVAGVERKAHFLAMDLPQSDGCFLKAYPAEISEAFCDGNDKGKVEGLIGYARRNFLVPIPRFESFEALNTHLEARCRERQGARLRGHEETIANRMARDRAAFLPLPSAPYDACDKRPGRVSSLSLVRYRDNDYSVPVAYGHREVLIRGYVDRVVISCASEVIARHRRSYEREDLVFDPLHYLPLIERKVGALDQAAPLRGWDLPAAFASLRRLLEARMGPRNHGAAGKREYVQVLRLLESFPLGEVEAAIREALRLGAIGFDAIKHLLLCRIERRPPRLDLNVYPYLPKAHVETTSAKAYMSLIGGSQP
jgi:transposase